MALDYKKCGGGGRCQDTKNDIKINEPTQLLADTLQKKKQGLIIVQNISRSTQ